MKTFEETLDPNEVKDFAFDWSPQLGTAETVTAHVVAFIAAAGTTNPSNSLASPISRVWLTGGNHGGKAVFTITATTSGGRTLEAALGVRIIDSLIGEPADVPASGSDLASLKQARADVWAAILAAAKGERIKEVWRDGRRIVRDNMSVAALEDLLARLDRDIADAQFAVGAAPSRGRRAISLAYRN